MIHVYLEIPSMHIKEGDDGDIKMMMVYEYIIVRIVVWNSGYGGASNGGGDSIISNW